MAKKYLDDIGLSHFFDKLKLLFATKDVATQSSDGLMSASDKIKVDSIEPLVNSANGITVSVGSASYLESLIVYGQSVQSGTPTPSNPVEIQVVQAPSGGTFGISVNETVTPIDLQSNVLASLPDGTKDVLTIDSTGHCALTKRVGKTTVDGSVAFGNSFSNSSTMRGNCTRITMNMSNFPTMESVALDSTNSYMSIAVAGATNASAAPYPGFYSKTVTSGVYLTLPSTLTSKADATAWLTTNNFDFFYPLAEATTIDLGYIDMPDIPDNASITISASLAPEISASWWTNYAEAIARAIASIKNLVI